MIKSANILVAVFYIIITLCSSKYSVGQIAISKIDALEDFRFLNDAIQYGHPENFNKHNSNRVNINDVIKTLESYPNDSLNYFVYNRLLRNAIFEIGCVHTKILKTIKQTSKAWYFPYTAKIFQEKLYLIKNDSVCEIHSINNIKAKEIIKPMNKYRGNDGKTTDFSNKIFNTNSSLMISSYFNFTEIYNIELKESKNITTFKIDSLIIEKEKPLPSMDIIKQEKDIIFAIYNNIPYLKISSFAKSHITFFRYVFKKIRKEKSQHLIIDLRGNLGGNRKAGMFLTQNLIDTIFSYSILQPKLKIRSFLNNRGKFQLLQSKWKYNIGNFYRAKKTELGKEFIYIRKPNLNNYNGQIIVLIDGYTASTSTMVASWLRQHSNTIFIGSPSAGGYNGNNGGSFPQITLPNSRTIIRFPAYRIILDRKSTDDQCINPDYIVIDNIYKLIFEKDLELEKAIEIINSKKTGKR